MGARTRVADQVRRPQRGEVFTIRGSGRGVVVSNDLRNQALPTVLVARITTTPKPQVETVVELPVGEPLVGRVLCDAIAEVRLEVLGKTLGPLSLRTMQRVDAGLRAALDLGRADG